jgi:hypothetical protein
VIEPRFVRSLAGQNPGEQSPAAAGENPAAGLLQFQAGDPMAVTEPAPGPVEEPAPVIDPDVPLPSEWTNGMKTTLDELEKLQRAKGLYTGSSVLEAGDDYQTAEYLLNALETALKAQFASDLVKMTKHNTPGWDPHAQT